MAKSYLVIISYGMGFYIINPIFTAILNGYGNSKIPFMINTLGLVINMVLDPVLIFGIGPIPAMGVQGAAIATVTAQLLVTLTFVITIRKKLSIFSSINFLKKPDMQRLNGIIKLGLPVAVQSGLFTIIAMVIARIISEWGATAIAVQKVGSQIEAISWMTAGGFSTAISAFIGQNYGANKWERINKGYYTAMSIVSVIGVIATCLLIFAPRFLFTIFITEEQAVEYGIIYLRILGVSQLFMCMEIATGGAFNGLGKTVPPSVVGITFNALRIPLAIILSSKALLGLNGVWWSISLSSILKGIVLVTWFVVFLNARKNIVKQRAAQIS